MQLLQGQMGPMKRHMTSYMANSAALVMTTLSYQNHLFGRLPLKVIIGLQIKNLQT